MLNIKTHFIQLRLIWRNINMVWAASIIAFRDYNLIGICSWPSRKKNKSVVNKNLTFLASINSTSAMS